MNKPFYVILDTFESLLTVGQRIVDIHRHSNVFNRCGTIVLARVEKLAPGLGIVFVSWGPNIMGNSKHYGILQASLMPARGPKDPMNGTNQKILQHGDYILVQIVQEARTQKVSLVSGHISLTTSRIVAWPGPLSAKLIGPCNHSCWNLQLRGFCAYMFRQDTVCAGPERWDKEKYALESQWEHLVLQLINQQDPIGSLSTTSGHMCLEKHIAWFQRPSYPWILLSSPLLRYNISKWMIRNCPHVTRKIDMIHFNDWKAWLSLHKAAISQPKIPLRSGGTVIIELTEVGWSLDINSGSALGIGSKETANEESIYAIVQQILLHCMRGLILIDFIPEIYIDNLLANLVNLSNLLGQDVYGTRIVSISQDGLVRILRSRSLYEDTSM